MTLLPGSTTTSREHLYHHHQEPRGITTTCRKYFHYHHQEPRVTATICPIHLCYHHLELRETSSNTFATTTRNHEEAPLAVNTYATTTRNHQEPPSLPVNTFATTIRYPEEPPSLVVYTFSTIALTVFVPGGCRRKRAIKVSHKLEIFSHENDYREDTSAGFLASLMSRLPLHWTPLSLLQLRLHLSRR